MSLDEKIRLMLALDALVKRKFRGNAREYAIKLGVARSTFFRLLEHIREEFKAPLFHNKRENRYEYVTKGSLFIGFLPVSSEELRKIMGGGVEIQKQIFFRVSTGGTDFGYV